SGGRRHTRFSRDWSSDVCSADLGQALAASGDDRAKAAAAALAKVTLFIRLEDNAVVIGEKDGEQYVITNALTGDIEAMAEPDELKPIELDDQIRALLGGAAEVRETGPFDFAAGVNGLKAQSFAEKGEAIAKLTALGDHRAMPVFQALADGRLFARKSEGALVIGDRSGNDIRITLAPPLEPAGIVPPADLDSVFVNNNLRNVLRESIAHLGLMSPDAAVRARAADALLEGITPETATLLREAYARESVAYVRDAMALSLAAAD